MFQLQDRRMQVHNLKNQKQQLTWQLLKKINKHKAIKIQKSHNTQRNTERFRKD